MPAQISNPGGVGNKISRGVRIAKRRAVLGDIENHIAPVAPAHPEEHFGQSLRVDLPTGLRVDAAALADARCAQRKRFGIVAHHPARVVVDAEEVDPLGDTGHVRLGNGPRFAEDRAELPRIPPPEDGV